MADTAVRTMNNYHRQHTFTSSTLTVPPPLPRDSSARPLPEFNANGKLDYGVVIRAFESLESIEYDEKLRKKLRLGTDKLRKEWEDCNRERLKRARAKASDGVLQAAA